MLKGAVTTIWDARRTGSMYLPNDEREPLHDAIVNCDNLLSPLTKPCGSGVRDESEISREMSDPQDSDYCVPMRHRFLGNLFRLWEALPLLSTE